MANKNTIEPRAIEDTVECIEALAEIVKKNDLGKLKINTETYEIVIEGRPCPPPMPAPMPMMGVPAPVRLPRRMLRRRPLLRLRLRFPAISSPLR